MFTSPISNSAPWKRSGYLVLALSFTGAGFVHAQGRLSERPPATPRPMPSMERPPATPRPMPSMERPPARVMPDRPGSPRDGRSVHRPTVREAPARPATNAIVAPRPMIRCAERPTPTYWQRRDIMAEIQHMARRGSIAVHPVGEDQAKFTGVADYPAGWMAYGFRVPAGENLHVRLTHSNEGWFRLGMVNKWGSLEEGMLQNLIPTGNPEVKYSNPSKETRSVYVIVDDPGWMSSKANPFNMKVTRSWDPAQKKVDDAPIVTGIWAQKQEGAKPEPATKEAAATPSKG